VVGFKYLHNGVIKKGNFNGAQLIVYVLYFHFPLTGIATHTSVGIQCIYATYDRERNNKRKTEKMRVPIYIIQSHIREIMAGTKRQSI